MSALTDLFGNIASAIRNKAGSTESITATNFPTAINNIPQSVAVRLPNMGSSPVVIPELIGWDGFYMLAVSGVSPNVSNGTGLTAEVTGTSGTGLKMRESAGLNGTAAITFDPATGTLTGVQPNANLTYIFIKK